MPACPVLASHLGGFLREGGRTHSEQKVRFASDRTFTAEILLRAGESGSAGGRSNVNDADDGSFRWVASSRSA